MLTPTHNILSAKMIRHYETIGLIARPVWQENNYLTYGADDFNRLRFIRRGRAPLRPPPRRDIRPRTISAHAR